MCILHLMGDLGLLKYLKIFFIKICVLSTLTTYSQDVDILNADLKFIVKEKGIKRILIKELKDTVCLKEVFEFDRNGKEIKWLTISGELVQKFTYRYDSLGRKIEQLRYDVEDTSKIIHEMQWTYFDSLNYVLNEYETNHTLYQQTKYSIKISADTIWIEEKEIYKNSGRELKHVARHINYADTLLTSEFIEFNSDGKMNAIDSYYKRWEDSLGYKTEYWGEYYPIETEDTLSAFLTTKEDLEEFFRDNENFLLIRLAGGFKYEYDYPMEIKKFDRNGRLIFSGTPNAYDNYLFNEQGQLIQCATRDSDEDGQEIFFISNYFYDKDGLITSIIYTDELGNITTTIYQYEFY